MQAPEKATSNTQSKSIPFWLFEIMWSHDGVMTWNVFRISETLLLGNPSISSGSLTKGQGPVLLTLLNVIKEF